MLGESRRIRAGLAGPRPRNDERDNARQKRCPTVFLGVAPRYGDGVEKIPVPRPKQNQTSREQQKQTESAHNRLLTPIDAAEVKCGLRIYC